MELLRVIKKALISLLLINVVIIGVCIFQIQNEIDDTDKLYTSLIEAYNEDENIDVQEYLKQSDEQMVLDVTQRFNASYSYISSYKDNKLRALKSADTLTQYELFNEEDSYSYKDIVKSSQDALKISDAPVKLINTLAIDKFMQYRWLPFLFILIITVVIISYKEEEYNSVNTLIRCSYNGRRSLVLKRLLINFLIILINSFAINLIVFCIFIYFYGGAGYLDNVIQCSQVFSNFPYVISIKHFMLLYCIFFAMAMYAISLIIYLFVQWSASNKTAYVKIILFGLAEWLLYYKINEKNSLNFFKYFNIFSDVMLADSLKNTNWGMDLFITDTITAFMYFTVILIVIGIPLNIILYIRKYPVRKLSIIDKLIGKAEQLVQRVIGSFNIGMFEMHKLLFMQNVFLILVIFIIAISSCKIHKGLNYNGQNTYIKNFYAQYEGSSSFEEANDYINYLEQTKEQLETKEKISAYDKKQIADIKTAQGSITSQLNYLNQLKQDNDIDGMILDESAYNEIFGDRMNTVQENINLICILVIIFMFSNIFNIEKKTKMTKLLKISKNRGSVWGYKLFTVIVISMLVGVISAVISWHNITDLYNIRFLNAPVQCIRMFNSFPINISISGYILLCQFIRVLLFISIGILIMNISYLAGYLHSVIIGMILLVPYILNVFKVSLMKYLSLPVQSDINRWLTMFNYNISGYIIYILFIISAVVLSIYTYYDWNTKK